MTRQNLDGIDYELLNHEPDEALRSKIKALWALADVTIANPEQRLSEIRAVAWQGDLLVAVSSCAAVREPKPGSARQAWGRTVLMAGMSHTSWMRPSNTRHTTTASTSIVAPPKVTVLVA